MYSLQTPVSLFLSCSVWAAWSSCVVTLLKSVACPPCHHHQRHTYILPTWEGNEGNQPLKRCTFCKPMAKHSHWMPLGHTHRYHCLKLYVPVDPTPTSSRFSYSLHGKWKHTQPPPPWKLKTNGWKHENERIKCENECPFSFGGEFQIPAVTVVRVVLGEIDLNAMPPAMSYRKQLTSLIEPQKAFQQISVNLMLPINMHLISE